MNTILALGALALFVSLARELVRLRRANDRLFRESRTDTLTGCWNVRHWKKRTAELEGRGEAFAFVLFDLANLKAANALLGHVGADEMLVEVSSRIRSETDTLFRIGGDEFAVLIRGGAVGDARTVRDRLERAAGLRTLAPGVPVFMAGGVGAWTPGAKLAERLRAADAELDARKVKRKLELGAPTTREATLATIAHAKRSDDLSSTAFRMA